MLISFTERFNVLYQEAKDKDYKITQTEFAKRFGATRNQVTGWLDGRSEPDIEMLKKIATISDISIEWLTGNSNVRSPITTIAAHRTDNIMDGLPPEAEERVLEFIELMKIKHGKKST